MQHIKHLDFKTLTDSEWQPIYKSIREIIPVVGTLPSRRALNPRCMKTYIQLTNGELDTTETLDSRHVKRIKDILKNIRSRTKRKPAVDYVYFLSDLIELMKYEKDLEIRLVHDEVTYWEVWINR
jgi:hypothetical protein